MGAKGFYYDMTTCIACRACQVACKDINDLDLDIFFRKVYEYEGGHFPKPWAYPISMSCNHCDNPICVQNCPTGALKKRSDGIVTHDEQLCIGCKLCTWSCPYQAPQYLESKGKTGKCDLCAELIDKGEEPACVAACTMRCLKFGDIDELRKQYGTIADAKNLPSSTHTRPNLVLTLNDVAKR